MSTRRETENLHFLRRKKIDLEEDDMHVVLNDDAEYERELEKADHDYDVAKDDLE